MASTALRPGDVAVVTGASSGLGRAIATRLAADGVTVVGIARRDDLLADAAQGWRAQAPGSGHRALDVTDHAALTAALSGIHDDHGRIDLLVNAAGIEERRAVIDADLHHYRTIFEVNVIAAVNATVAVLPGMAQRDRGFVVNVSSDQGRAPTPMTSAYSASKAALSAFTESAAYEHHGTGVHLHVLYPGWVPTGLGRKAVEHGMPQPPRAVRRTPDQVAEALVAGLGRKFEINVAGVAALAPLARAIAPRSYARNLSAR